MKTEIFSRLRKSYDREELARRFDNAGDEAVFDEEKKIAARWVRPDDKVLLVGGGGSKDVRFWETRCSRLAVADLSLKMLQISRSASLSGKPIYLLSGNLVALPFHGAAFDHVVVCESVYGHIPGRKNRQKILRKTAALIKSGGNLVLYSGGWLSADTVFTALRMKLGKLRVLKQWLMGNFSAREPGDARTHRLLYDVPADASFFYHFFQTSAEIEEELRGSGLAVLDRAQGIWVLGRQGEGL